MMGFKGLGYFRRDWCQDWGAGDLLWSDESRTPIWQIACNGLSLELTPSKAP
jgi:hypothetical protein